MNALSSRLLRILPIHATASFEVAAAARRVSRVVALSSSLSSSAVPSKYMPPTADKRKQKKENESSNKKKKSPHSKLLRVCSPQNANVHFAAIEADMLRLNWSSSMNTLVEAWFSKYKFSNFIELESNVRLYVLCNMVDLLHYEKDDFILSHQTISYNKEDAEDGVASSDGGGGGGSTISLSDHIRYKLFPYERIIKEIVRCAIIPIGENNMKEDENNISSGSNSSSSSYEDVLERRVMHLLSAGKLLDAMMTLDGSSSGSSGSSGNNGVLQQLEGVSSWTVHHETCSDCLRLVVSAWSLLYRRQCALITTTTTTTTMTKFEYELLVWTERWIDLCSCGEEMTNSSSILLASQSMSERRRKGRGILHSDEILLIDTAKISVKFEKFAKLENKIHCYFRHIE